MLLFIYQSYCKYCLPCRHPFCVYGAVTIFLSTLRKGLSSVLPNFEAGSGDEWKDDVGASSLHGSIKIFV